VVAVRTARRSTRSPSCSTADGAERRAFKIFATDVHHGSLEVATRALYDEKRSPTCRVAAVALLRAHGKHYKWCRAAAAVVFANHNVVKDAPFTRVDMVSCRNMLIYLQPAAQEKVLSRFHFALNRGA